MNEAHNWQALALQIKQWGQELGFQQIGITDIDLSSQEKQLSDWLAKGYHGEMTYMEKHGHKRSRPAELIPGTLRIISVRMDYLPEPLQDSQNILKQKDKAFISRYALGRDYHKVLKKQLEKLAEKIRYEVGEFGYRAFVDSAPVLETAIAEKAGLGWKGKHTLVINSKAGSWFFLGELYTDLPLPIDPPATAHCGTCRACLDVCPTQAIIAPHQLDARRCISYLTIELKGSIPIELRPLMGNRIYGCDDCQLYCPWNKFAKLSVNQDFQIRHRLNDIDLVELFSWQEEEFLQKMQGSAIRRIGYERWLRNIAVALGNAPTNEKVVSALKNKLNHPSALVKEHVAWALAQHTSSSPE